MMQFPQNDGISLMRFVLDVTAFQQAQIQPRTIIFKKIKKTVVYQYFNIIFAALINYYNERRNNQIF